MCGIFGYLMRGARDTPLQFSRAIAALKHRGPNDSGQFEGRVGDIRCGLAHTRLSIVDLSDGGHQPMSAHEGRFTIVYNGEVYNAAEVKQELEARGEVFVSHCDTEVVLKAYACWGERCLRKLNGMFAFAVWDASKGELFLARDRLGVKPLYYVLTDTRLVFSSEVRALLATGAVARTLSIHALRGYLAFGSVQEPTTIIRGIRAMPSGASMVYSGKASEPQSYWTIPSQSADVLTERQAVVRTRELLHDAVQSRLTADVPVGIFLSGGIDSTVITALASKAAPRPVHTFTLSYGEKAWDEQDVARYVAKRFGCEHHDVVLSSTAALGQIDDAMAALDQPSADGQNSFFVSKAARESGLIVALSGIGADELFAGYHYFRAFKYLMQAQRVLGRLTLSGRSPFRAQSSARLRKLSLLLTSTRTAEEAYGVLRAMFDSDDARGLVHPQFAALGWTVGDISRRDLTTDPVAAWSALELAGYLRNTLLRDSDAMSMAHGLEVREPFLDYRLVEHVIGLPARYKLKLFAKKPHLVAAIPELPKHVVRRRKMGFTLPLDVWLRGELRHWAEERLLSNGLWSPSWLSRGAVEDAWHGFLSSQKHPSASRIWALISLVDWARRHNVGI